MTIVPVVFSYFLAALSVPVVLHFKLLPAVLAGLAVHVVTGRLAALLPKHWSGVAQKVGLGVFAAVVTLLLLGVGFGLWSFLSGGGLSALLASAAATVDNMRRMLPASVANNIPSSVDELRQQLAVLLREHGRGISVVGLEGVRFFAHVLVGMVIGGMTSLHRFRGREHLAPFAQSLHARAQNLADSFAKVVLAQVTISLLNTALTAIYLLAILPLFDIYLPMRAVLLVLTFIAGLLPVVGNLISNVVIILISLGISVNAGIASVVFLLAIHKLEYFTNAKIVGGKVHASSWELLCSMVLMEAIFGIGGLVAAPVVYAWIKLELKAKAMI